MLDMLPACSALKCSIRRTSRSHFVLFTDLNVLTIFSD